MPVDGTAFISANYIGRKCQSVPFLLLILAMPLFPLAQMKMSLLVCLSLGKSDKITGEDDELCNVGGQWETMMGKRR